MESSPLACPGHVPDIVDARNMARTWQLSGIRPVFSGPIPLSFPGHVLAMTGHIPDITGPIPDITGPILDTTGSIPDINYILLVVF